MTVARAAEVIYRSRWKQGLSRVDAAETARALAAAGLLLTDEIRSIEIVGDGLIAAQFDNGPCEWQLTIGQIVDAYLAPKAIR